MAASALFGFVVVLAVIGGLELVDRTSFALIGLSARLRAIGAWGGAAAAFLVTTSIAVGVGTGLEAVLGPGRLRWLRVAGGLFLIGYAAYTLWTHDDEAADPITDLRGAFVAAFGTILALELGDTTMIFEIVFVPSFGWLTVLVAGSAALISVAAWDVWLGRRLAVHLAPATVRKLVAAILFVVGALTVLFALAPSALPTFGIGGTG